MPVVKDVGQIMDGEKERKKLVTISLSASTVKRRIIDMSNDVLEQIESQVKTPSFVAMQLNESTDIAGLAQFSVFI